jgi:hypothetical protein
MTVATQEEIDSFEKSNPHPCPWVRFRVSVSGFQKPTVFLLRRTIIQKLQIALVAVEQKAP